MEQIAVAYPSQTMLPIYQIIRHHIPPGRSSKIILTHESE